MIVNGCRYLLLMLALTALSVCPAAAQHAETVTLGTGDYPPLSGEELDSGGMCSEIVMAAFKETGIQTSLEFLPWKRAEQRALEHRLAGVFPYVRSEERERDYLFSAPVYTVRNMIFTSRESKVRSSSERDLAGRTVCHPHGYTTRVFQSLLDRNILELTARPVSLADCLRRMKEGVADFVIINEAVGWHVARQTFGNVKEIRTVGEPYSLTPQHLMIPRSLPGAQTLLERFNKGLALLEEKGTLTDIIVRHLGQVKLGQ